jgi:hypothetical protein
VRRTRHTRYTAGIVAAALALGTAGPADAVFLNSEGGGSHVPAGPSQTLPQSLPQTPSHVTGGAVSELEYIAIGTGGTVVLIGVGGTLAASRRRQHSSAVRY